MIGSTVVQNTTFVLLLFSGYVSGVLYLVYCCPCLIICRYTIFVFLYFSRLLLIIFSVVPVQVFIKPCFIALRSLAVVGMKNAVWSYCAISGLDFCISMLFITASYCCVLRSTSHIPFLLFMVPLILYCPFFWTGISCLYSVMVYTSSHKTPNDISGAVFVFRKIWICLACFIRPGIWSVAMCEEFIVLPSCSLAFI